MEQRKTRPPIPLPVLYSLKYTNALNGENPVYYESRLISLICVEKISIYKALLSNEGKNPRNRQRCGEKVGARSGENKRKKEHEARESERDGVH